MFFCVPHWLDSRIEMLQSGLLFVRRLSRCFKVGFFSTPNLEVHQNRFLLYAEIRLRTKMQKHDFVLCADIQDAPKWIYFYTHNFEMHQSGKKKVRVL